MKSSGGKSEVSPLKKITQRYGEKRIDSDILKLMRSGYEVEKSDNENVFYVTFEGPTGTVYEGGRFVVRLTLTSKYPVKSPSLGFVTKIYHPNVEPRSGSICLDVLNTEWTSLYDLNVIFDTFLPQLLSNPNPMDPLNSDAAYDYLNYHENFEFTVKKMVEKQTGVLKKQENFEESKIQETENLGYHDLNSHIIEFMKFDSQTYETKQLTVRRNIYWMNFLNRMRGKYFDKNR